MAYRGREVSASLPEELYLYVINLVSQMSSSTGKKRRHPTLQTILRLFFFFWHYAVSSDRFSRARFPFLPKSRQHKPWLFHFLPLKLTNQTITQACFNCLFHLHLFDLCLILSERSVGGRGRVLSLISAKILPSNLVFKKNQPWQVSLTWLEHHPVK